MACQIKVGDIVRFTPQWCDEGEENDLNVVMEVWYDVEKAVIKSIDSEMFFAPITTVTLDMIEPIGINVENLQGN